MTNSARHLNSTSTNAAFHHIDQGRVQSEHFGNAAEFWSGLLTLYCDAPSCRDHLFYVLFLKFSTTPNSTYSTFCGEMVIVRVSYGYGYTRGSGRVRVAILGTGRVRVRVSTAATGTGRVAEMVDPHTSTGSTE